MEEEKYSALVVGSGQCGGRIAATFNKKPNFMKTRREDYYPISCFVFDTDPSIKDELTEKMGFSLDNIFILSSASEEEIVEFILGKKVEEEKEGIIPGTVKRIKQAGIGGMPFLGRIAAKKHFVEDKKKTAEPLLLKLKPSKTLLTVNSLTGGTGTGFSPFVIDFLGDPKGPVRGLVSILNLSIIPADLDEIYPNSIVSTLHYMLNVKAVDGIILMDNKKMRDFGCKNIYEYNDKIHEIFSPILLSPVAKHQASDFGASLDHADLKRWTRPHLGFGKSDLCALGYSSGRPGILQKREDFLTNLADSAIESTTIDCEPKSSSGVAVLSASPEFYKKFLRRDAGYYDSLVEHLRGKLGTKRLKLSFLQFDDMKKVYLTVLMSGVYSPRIKDVCERGGFELSGSGSVGEKIRGLDEEEVDRMVKEEIRKNI